MSKFAKSILALQTGQNSLRYEPFKFMQVKEAIEDSPEFPVHWDSVYRIEVKLSKLVKISAKTDPIIVERIRKDVVRAMNEHVFGEFRTDLYDLISYIHEQVNDGREREVLVEKVGEIISKMFDEV